MPSGYINCDYYLTGERQAKLTVEGADYLGAPLLNEVARQSFDALWQEDAATEYGAALFQALLPPGSDLLWGYHIGLKRAQHEEKWLRFRLHVDALPPPNLHELHWELLADAKEKIALSRNRGLAFSRYANVQLPPPALITAKPRLLVVIASPADIKNYDLPELDRDEAMIELRKVLQPLAQVEVEFLDPPATISRIRDKLLDGGFHALHILAHGAKWEERTALVLQKEDGAAQFVNEDLFGEVVQGIETLRLVVLIACHGGAQLRDDPFGGLGPALLRRYVPAVIAMRQAVSLQAARVFTEHFYLNLARTGQVDAASNEARQQMYLTFSARSEWGTPALFLRLHDARLWEPPAVPRSAITVRGGTEIPWARIKQHLKERRVVPIIGPGITRGLLLAPKHVAHHWADEWKERLKEEGRVFPFTEYQDLPRVAKYVDIVSGESRGVPHEALLQLLKENLIDLEDKRSHDRMRELPLHKVINEIAPRHFDLDEDEPHRVLAELPINTYLTTNYDTFMTAAFAWRQRKVQQACCDWQSQAEDDNPDPRQYKNLQGTSERPLVFHVYGDDRAGAMVLTEDDYLEFLRKISRDKWRLPPRLGRDLAQSTLVFLGFNITDLDFRVLWKGVIEDVRAERTTERIAVLQLNPYENVSAQEEAFRDFQAQCGTHIKLRVYPDTVREFLKELKS